MQLSTDGGIYLIRNLRTRRVYAGEAANLALRRSTHFSALRRGKHHNPQLQDDFRIHGEASFVFEIAAFIRDAKL